MMLTTQSANDFAPWFQFKTPIVRQLAFCLASPNIIQQVPDELEIQYSFQLHPDEFWTQQYQQYQSRLWQLDQRPDVLIHFLDQLKSTRLGLRFEYLFWFWLQDQQYHHYQLLGHSLQKIEGARTLGELDFLVLNRSTQEIEHWEVALKYYLAEGDFRLDQWIGLNREDTLRKKLQHFTNRQFQFSTANGYSIQRKFAVIKGQLYLPLSNDSLLPNWVNPHRQLGRWGTQIPETPYYRLQRHEWLCPDQTVSSQPAHWWTNGLYHNAQDSIKFYMFRQSSLLFNQAELNPCVNNIL